MSILRKSSFAGLVATLVIAIGMTPALADPAEVTNVEFFFEYETTQYFPCGDGWLGYGELVDWEYEVRHQYRGVVDPNGARHVSNPVFTRATGVGQTSGETYHLNETRTFNITQSTSIFNNIVSGHTTIVGPGGNHYKADMVIHWIWPPGEGTPTGVQVNLENCTSA
jgi:hypothetical protein